MFGPCAKQTVTCKIFPTGHHGFVGRNACANAQPTCPRAPGEGYAKCQSVCQQGGHAEIQALAAAREAGADLEGATAIITGHYYACEPCARALRDAGVSEILILLKP
jgi:deoxycytidylate deaminase